MAPRHLADLDAAGRKAAVEALGHKGFRAGQLSKHYFERLVDAPEEMTDLPGAARTELEHRPFGVVWAPANVTVQGVTHTEVELDWAEAGVLSEQHINPIVIQPNRGIVVFGARPAPRGGLRCRVHFQAWCRRQCRRQLVPTRRNNGSAMSD